MASSSMRNCSHVSRLAGPRRPGKKGGVRGRDKSNSFDLTSNGRSGGKVVKNQMTNDKDVAAMLDELTIEANEESFVIVLQHGGYDVR